MATVSATTSAPPSAPAEAAVEPAVVQPAVVPVAARTRTSGEGFAAVRRVAAHLVHVLWPLAAVFVAWTLWVELKNLPPAVAPHPVDVVKYIADNPRTYLVDGWHTIRIVVLGVLAGGAAGVLLASISWFSSLARAMISVPAMITQCLPVATLVPVIARVFGYQERTVIIIAGLIAFFPVMVFTASGLQATPAGSDDLFRVFGAGRWDRFRLLAVPSAVPRLLVSLRLSVVASVVGAMLAQWIMGTEGLGYRLAVAQASFRTSEAWGASVVAIIVGVVLYAIAAALYDVAKRRFT